MQFGQRRFQTRQPFVQRVKFRAEDRDVASSAEASELAIMSDRSL